MRAAILILFVMFVNSLFAQKTNNLILDIKKVDSLTYSAAIFNKSDSVLCILTSPHFSHSQSLYLPIYQTTEQIAEYKFNYSLADSQIDPAIPVYRGECILPYQALIVTFKIDETSKEKSLLLNFFYSDDFHFKSFKKEVLKRNWHKKYKVVSRNFNFR